MWQKGCYSTCIVSQGDILTKLKYHFFFIAFVSERKLLTIIINGITLVTYHNTNSSLFSPYRTPTHQQGIPDEENGGVVTSQVPVTLLRVELDCKASGISHRVR